ncbi:MAG: hypothetical protein ACTH1D_08165 [Mycobacteriaceae bacterium]
MIIPPMSGDALTRRPLLAGSAGLAGAALLSGCGSSGGDIGTNTTAGHPPWTCPRTSPGDPEFLTVQYGKEGVNYELDSDGQPVVKPNGRNELFPITLFPGALVRHYAPDFPEVVKNECAYEAEVSKNVILNAAVGPFSATATQKGAQLAKHIEASLGEVIQGHRKVSEWADVVKAWADKGGDQIRQEYEEASAAP